MIHELYAKLTEWQIRRARAHARECGPGSILVETSPSHRVRLPPAKLDHFLDFVNRPYFYQDVAFGTRKLSLNSGEKITMPNVIRKVTRSTMVRQYLQFCKEEQFELLSRATLFRILDVREASQQRSLSGLDNIATDGSAGFQRLSRIVEELDQIGLEKSMSDELRKSLHNGKRYFKVRVTVRMMKASVPTTVVNLVSAIRMIQISKNIVHTNICFVALNVLTSLPVCRRCIRLSRIAKP